MKMIVKLEPGWDPDRLDMFYSLRVAVDLTCSGSCSEPAASEPCPLRMVYWSAADLRLSVSFQHDALPFSVLSFSGAL